VWCCGYEHLGRKYTIESRAAFAGRRKGFVWRASDGKVLKVNFETDLVRVEVSDQGAEDLERVLSDVSGLDSWHGFCADG